MKRAELRQKAFAGAREVMGGKTTLSETANKHGVSRDIISEVRLILEHGSPDDISNAETGKMGISPIANKIRSQLSPEFREERRKRYVNGIFTDTRRVELHNKAALWAKLGPALKGLVELPTPADMVKIAMSHRDREQTVTHSLETAIKWLEEFKHVWDARGTVRAPEGPDNAGDGDPASGAQYPKSAA